MLTPARRATRAVVILSYPNATKICEAASMIAVQDET